MSRIKSKRFIVNCMLDANVKKMNEEKQILKKIGLKIKECRVQKGMTQKELSIILSMETSQITRIERGVINTSVLSVIRIASVLDMSIDSMLKN